MKLIFSLLLLSTASASAQQTLVFDRRFVQSEDRWVAFKPDKDNSYPFGFIYIDPQAGLTLNFEGSFTISPSGAFITKRLDTTNIKIRLEPNDVQVAWIPENKFDELGIEAVPNWLAAYKSDSGSTERLLKWGFMYNGWNECAKALTYLERAWQADRHFKGLAVELAYSYNCLEQFEKAETILAEEIQTNPGDAYVNKEYIYTLSKAKKIEAATAQFEKSMKTVKDNQYHAENCYNIMAYYYNEKNKEAFARWYRIFLKLPNSNKTMAQYAETMQAQLNK